LSIAGGAGQGLTATLTAYTPGERPTATIDADWVPDATSRFEIASDAGEPVTGGGLSVEGRTIAFGIGFNGGAQPATDLAGRRLAIVDGAGRGLAATIRAYTPGERPMATVDADWIPDATSEYSVVRPTTYTIKAAGERLHVYAESDDPAALIQYHIGQIDEIISRQVSAIMHHPDFQRLEATWRGLHDLVFNSETGSRLKLRLMNVTRQELQADLENAVEFDQSAVFKKVYEEEYGMFGGSPYSALLADFAFGPLPQDVSLLAKLFDGGKAHGPATITDANGRRGMIAQFAHGRLDGPAQVVADGAPRALAHYRAGLQHGVTTAYHADGAPSRVATYSHGVLEGEHTLHYPHGAVLSRARYRAGALHGEYTEYFPTGAVKETAFYKDGNLHGEMRRYDERGSVVETHYYQDGDLVSSAARGALLPTFLRRRG
jgi:hypothetical protein